VSQNLVPVIVKILDKEYRVACQQGEQDDLLGSAHFLDQKMREIRDRGKVIGADRIAVMAALNLANELLLLKADKEGDLQSVNNRLKNMQDKIEIALNEGKQLEL
jgi:cell division protein ZapA